jgi:hypothetical protein
VDLLGERGTAGLGPPTHYVAHAWAAPFDELVASLRAYFALAKAESEEVFLWIGGYFIQSKGRPRRRTS